MQAVRLSLEDRSGKKRMGRRIKMKEFEYTWDDACFLLHVQLNKNNEDEYQVSIIRSFTDRDAQSELERMRGTARSHRFIVSRSHPNEHGFVLRYPEQLTLEAFKIEDRAFYPTHPFFIG